MEVKIETDSNDATEIKTEADSNDIIEGPHYDGPSIGMFGLFNMCIIYHYDHIFHLFNIHMP